MKIPKVPKNVISYMLTIIFLPALIAIINSVAGNLGSTFKLESAGKTENPIKSQTEQLITQESTEKTIGDNNNCPTQISGSDTVSINCSVNNTDTIENQENTEAEQVNINNGSNPINCNRSNGSCGDGSTTNINIEKE